MTSPFLAPRNLDHIFNICYPFLRDKYNVELPDAQLRSILKQCMEELMEYYHENPPAPAIDELNKRTIIKAKDHILILMRELNMPRPPPPPAPSVNVSALSQPPPVPPSPIMEDQDHSEDTEIFLKKLQNLELQRTATVVTPPSEPLLKPTAPPTPPPSTGTTVLYLPSSSAPIAPRISKPFVIYSGDRMWNYFHERAIMSWEGPLPVSDSMYMRCTSLLISQAQYIVSPIIKVRIEGPGNHMAETICTFAKKGRKWDIWEPASESIGNLRVVPSPWTIRLYDMTDRLLDLGKDGYAIQEAVKLLNGNTKWTFVEMVPMLTRGMTLLCRGGDGTIKKHTALHVHENAVEVEGAHTDAVGCVCAIEDLQITIIMEIIKNESGSGTSSSVDNHGNTPVPARLTGSGVARGTISTPKKSGK